MDRRLYNIWSCMRQRCNNPKHTAAQWYHYKGIRLCEEWESNFESFQSWAISNGYRDDLTIDRVDPNGNYCPENCRWISKSENSRRANKGKTKKGVNRHGRKAEIHIDDKQVLTNHADQRFTSCINRDIRTYRSRNCTVEKYRILDSIFSELKNLPEYEAILCLTHIEERLKGFAEGFAAGKAHKDQQ